MNARTKLNASYLNGGLFFAALVGWLTSSWLIFLVVAAVVLVGSMHAGNIRMQPSTGSIRHSQNRR